MVVIDDSELEKTIFSPVCTKCKHITNMAERKCAAFKSIPAEIWDGGNNHRKPFSGDNGIRFELVGK